MIDNAKAAEIAIKMVSIVPSTWKVRIDSWNNLAKVVASAEGMAIVCNPKNGLFYVTVDNGPGMVEDVSASYWGEEGFEDPLVAFNTLKELITKRFFRVEKQFKSFKSSPKLSMTNAETANHLREWVTKPHGVFSWPTDGCGYDQHTRFVHHRNTNWFGDSNAEFKKFVLEYADMLDKEND